MAEYKFPNVTTIDRCVDNAAFELTGRHLSLPQIPAQFSIVPQPDVSVLNSVLHQYGGMTVGSTRMAGESHLGETLLLQVPQKFRVDFDPGSGMAYCRNGGGFEPFFRISDPIGVDWCRKYVVAPERGSSDRDGNQIFRVYFPSG